MVAQASVGLSAPWLEDGTLWWLESRPLENGRVVLVRREPGGEPADVVPEEFNVRTSVHEYGGGAYCVHGETAFVSNFSDQRLYRVDPGGEPVAITPDVGDRRHRYADGSVTADGGLWIGVRERHAESDRSADVINELVAIATDGSAEPVVLVGGRDFYSNPRISPDGSRLCFLAWDLPWMPWDGCELHVADLASDGALTNVEHVAGLDGRESIWQPEWSPEGDLVFASDRSGWWNLERIRDGERSVLHAAEAEFGFPAWVFGSRSYAFLGDGRIFCTYEQDGFTHYALLDPSSAAFEHLDIGLEAGSVAVAAEGSSAVFVGGSPSLPTRLVRFDVETGGSEVVRASSELALDPAYLSTPRAIEFPTEGGKTASRARLRARESRLRGPRGRASAAPRVQPRRPDGQRERRLQPREAVLDQPRLRHRRRELRRLDGLRARVPRTPEREVGGRRPRRLRERGAPPRRAGRGRPGPAPDPRRERGWLHDDLRAHLHGRVRGRRLPTSASPTSSSSQTVRRTSSSSRTSTRWSARIRSRPPSTASAARSTT